MAKNIYFQKQKKERTKMLVVTVICIIILLSVVSIALGDEDEPQFVGGTAKEESSLTSQAFFLIIVILLILLIVMLVMFKKIKMIWFTSLIGGITGAVIGLFSPVWTQLQIVNSFCNPIGGTPQYHTLCFRDAYLSLFGTQASGGNWHLILYTPLFIFVWAIILALVGGIIGLFRYILKTKKTKNEKVQ